MAAANTPRTDFTTWRERGASGRTLRISNTITYTGRGRGESVIVAIDENSSDTVGTKVVRGIMRTTRFRRAVEALVTQG